MQRLIYWIRSPARWFSFTVFIGGVGIIYRHWRIVHTCDSHGDRSGVTTTIPIAHLVIETVSCCLTDAQRLELTVRIACDCLSFRVKAEVEYLFFESC